MATESMQSCQPGACCVQNSEIGLYKIMHTFPVSCFNLNKDYFFLVPGSSCLTFNPSPPKKKKKKRKKKKKTPQTKTHTARGASYCFGTWSKILKHSPNHFSTARKSNLIQHLAIIHLHRDTHTFCSKHFREKCSPGPVTFSFCPSSQLDGSVQAPVCPLDGAVIENSGLLSSTNTHLVMGFNTPPGFCAWIGNSQGHSWHF
jgi:hypothetical protein